MVRTVNVGHDVWIFKMLKCVSLWIYWTRATGLSWDHLGDTGSRSDTLHSLHSLGYNPALVTILTTQGLRLRHPRVFHDSQPGHPPPSHICICPVQGLQLSVIVLCWSQTYLSTLVWEQQIIVLSRLSSAWSVFSGVFTLIALLWGLANIRDNLNVTVHQESRVKDRLWSYLCGLMCTEMQNFSNSSQCCYLVIKYLFWALSKPPAKSHFYAHFPNLQYI